jgi:hypothetical protein
MSIDVKSKILLTEEVENKDFRLGQTLEYYPAIVIGEDGKETPALFTAGQLAVAMGRARSNPEDIPEKKSFLSSLFGG